MRWTHLAATYDGTTTRLYVNGTQVSSQAQTGAMAASTNPLQIGGDSLYGQFFQGTIDEVRIYNVALTAAQIQTDMNAPISAVGATNDTQPPTAPANLTATAISSQPDQFELDGFDRHCGSDRLSAATQPGDRFDEFHPAGDPDRNQLQRHEFDGGDDLQLPGTGDGRGRQFERLFERGKYDDSGFGHDGADGAVEPGGSAVSSSQINLSWTASTDNCGGDRLSAATQPGERVRRISRPVATPTGTNYSDTGLTAGTIYNYRVRRRTRREI